MCVHLPTDDASRRLEYSSGREFASGKPVQSRVAFLFDGLARDDSQVAIHRNGRSARFPLPPGSGKRRRELTIHPLNTPRRRLER